MSEPVRVVTRAVRQITIDTGRPWAEIRAAYEEAVPHFDRLEALGIVLSKGGWDGITRLSQATAKHGFVNFFAFDPSPVMALNGNTGKGVTYLTGNILKAEVGFGLDPACFLYVPLRVVIASAEDGNARLSIDHPVDLFAAYDDARLAHVGSEFASAFASLLEHLGVPVPPELRDA